MRSPSDHQRQAGAAFADELESVAGPPGAGQICNGDAAGLGIARMVAAYQRERTGGDRNGIAWLRHGAELFEIGIDEAGIKGPVPEGPGHSRDGAGTRHCCAGQRRQWQPGPPRAGRALRYDQSRAR